MTHFGAGGPLQAQVADNGWDVVFGIVLDWLRARSFNCGTAVIDSLYAGAVSASSVATDALVVEGSATINNFELGTVETTLNGGTVHDATFGTATVTLLNCASGTTVTGMAGGSNGRPKLVVNVGTNNITFKNDDAGSLAENRLLVGTSGGFVLSAEKARWFVYSNRLMRWVLVG